MSRQCLSVILKRETGENPVRVRRCIRMYMHNAIGKPRRRMDDAVSQKTCLDLNMNRGHRYSLFIRDMSFHISVCTGSMPGMDFYFGGKT